MIQIDIISFVLMFIVMTAGFVGAVCHLMSFTEKSEREKLAELIKKYGVPDVDS